MNLEASIHQVEAFVREHAGWAPAIVFALAFGESLAFISLLIPAWGALVAIGALIGPGGVSFWPVWIAGCARRRARRLAVLLDRPQARIHRRPSSGRCRAIPTSFRAAKPS